MCRRRMVTWSVVVSLGCLAVGGCGNNGWSSFFGAGGSRLSGVAVVDLDEVARQLGRDASMLKQMNEGQTSLNQQLRTLQASFQEKYQQTARDLTSQPAPNGANPDAKKQQLAGLEREMGLQLNRAKQTAQNNLNAYRQQLIQQFREEVAPVAKTIAAERGLGVVVTKNDTVLLTFDDAHDITAEVVAKLRNKPTLGAPSAAPATADHSTPSSAPRR
ncbi:MAG: OmpH family outer membrane protein [Thermoguttaceae bacterium]